MRKMMDLNFIPVAWREDDISFATTDIKSKDSLGIGGSLHCRVFSPFL